MEGACDGCGKKAELTTYTRQWFGNDTRTSYLCSECLKSIKRRPNKAGERVPPPKRPRERSVGPEKPSGWAAYREWQKSQQEEDDYRPSIVVSVDGKERINAVGRSPTRPPSARKLRTMMRLLVEEENKQRPETP